LSLIFGKSEAPSVMWLDFSGNCGIVTLGQGCPKAPSCSPWTVPARAGKNMFSSLGICPAQHDRFAIGPTGHPPDSACPSPGWRLHGHEKGNHRLNNQASACTV